MAKTRETVVQTLTPLLAKCSSTWWEQTRVRGGRLNQFQVQTCEISGARTNDAKSSANPGRQNKAQKHSKANLCHHVQSAMYRSHKARWNTKIVTIIQLIHSHMRALTPWTRHFRASSQERNFTVSLIFQLHLGTLQQSRYFTVVQHVISRFLDTICDLTRRSIHYIRQQVYPPIFTQQNTHSLSANTSEGRLVQYEVITCCTFFTAHTMGSWLTDSLVLPLPFFLLLFLMCKLRTFLETISTLSFFFVNIWAVRYGVIILNRCTTLC